MVAQFLRADARIRAVAFCGLIIGNLGLIQQSAQAQCRGFGQQQSVGGISIDVAGVLKNAERDEARRLQQVMQRALQDVPGDLKEKTELRKVSLRRLEAAIGELQQAGAPLTDDIRYLGGLQRIQYVFVFPEERDIVLAGPAEGWQIDDVGNVVGLTTGWPVMLLDDLLVALRSTENARRGGISCSIDPTPAGLARLQELAKALSAMGPDTITAIEQTLGQQRISVSGVPATSHFARVLVAADYKMKRLAMNFDTPPIQGLPGFLTLAKAGPVGMQSMLPRWWLEPAYGTMLADPDGLAWELRGAGVKAVTEEDFVNAQGARQRTGKANPVAQKWADNMTAHYDELAKKEAIFGQLRNCIDLAIVAALVAREELTERVNYRFPLLFNDEHLPAEKFHAPQEVASQASVIKKGQNWLISASGGVVINPWMMQKSEPSSQLGPMRAKSAAKTTSWWWN